MKNKADWKKILDGYQKEYQEFYIDRKTGVNMHQGRYKSLMDNIMLRIFENEKVFLKQMEKSVKSGWMSEDDYRNILLDVFKKFMSDYDPFAGRNIYGYITDHCTWAVRSRVDKLAGVDRNKDKDLDKEERKKKRAEKYNKTPILYEDLQKASDTTQPKVIRLKNQSDLSDEIIGDEDEHDEAFLELAAIVLDFTKNHNRKTGTPQRRLLYELFYSTDIINYCKDPYSSESLRHEHVVMSAMHIPYSNFCTALPNQYDEKNVISIKKIRENPFKTVGELVPSSASPLKPDEEAKAPLGNQPILGYMEKVEKSDIKDSGLSQQRKKYFEEVYPIFVRRRLLAQ